MVLIIGFQVLKGAYKVLIFSVLRSVGTLNVSKSRREEMERVYFS